MRLKHRKICSCFPAPFFRAAFGSIESRLGCGCDRSESQSIPKGAGEVWRAMHALKHQEGVWCFKIRNPATLICCPTSGVILLPKTHQHNKRINTLMFCRQCFCLYSSGGDILGPWLMFNFGFSMLSPLQNTIWPVMLRPYTQLPKYLVFTELHLFLIRTLF